MSYFLMLLMMSGISVLMVMVISMEILSWLFVSVSETVSLKYLLVQSFFLLASLASIMTLESLLVITVMLKVGLPPLHSWILQVFFLLDKFVFLFMSTVHKLLPLLFLTSLLSMNLCLTMMILVLGLSLSLLPMVTSFLLVIGVSSMMHSSWLVLGGGLSLSFFLTYWLLYSLLTAVMLFSVVLISENKYLSLNQSLLTSTAWLVVSGLPPLMVFWLKVVAISVLLSLTTEGVLLALLLLVLSIVAYFRVFVIGKLVKESHSKAIPLIMPLTLFILY